MTSDRVLKPDPLPVRRLLDFADLDLLAASGKEGLDRLITKPELNRPAIEICGFFDKWEPERVQIFGSGESALLDSRFDDPSIIANLERIFASRPPCIVITNGIAPRNEILEHSKRFNTPVLLTGLHTTGFIKRLWDHLDFELSPYVVKRGVLMDVYNVGVLIIGESSVGKSECALELLTKGHTFVADDLVLIRVSQMTHLMGTGRSPVPHHMEIRGIGIIDISRMYGPRCVRQSKQVDMVVQLEEWDAGKEYERLGIECKMTDILGIELPLYNIPVKPGRNIGTILEVAVLDLKLKQSGVHMAREFDEKLIQIMRKVEGQ